MREMTFAQIKRLFDKLTLLLSRFKTETVGEKGSFDGVEVSTLVTTYADKFFDVVCELLNFLFAFKNEGYEPVDVDFVSENMTLPMLFAIVEDVAEVNGIPWIVPFLKRYGAVAAQSVMRTFTQQSA